MRIFLNIICIILFGISSQALARPVSYPGGWTVMQNNNMDVNSFHIHYSPQVNYSVGYKVEYWRNEDWQFHGVQLNYLSKRWNQPASQANLYLKTGMGIAYSDFGAFENEVEPAAFAGIAFDWEDRRYFTSYENRAYYAGDIDKFFTQRARLGMAPYIGDYGDMHTWLMIQIDHNPSKDDEITFTPLLRIFKGEYLAEAGFSDDGDVLFNWIIRF